MKRLVILCAFQMVVASSAWAISTSPNPGSAGTTTAVTGSAPITSTGGTDPRYRLPDLRYYGERWFDHNCPRWQHGQPIAVQHQWRDKCG